MSQEKTELDLLREQAKQIRARIKEIEDRKVSCGRATYLGSPRKIMIKPFSRREKNSVCIAFVDSDEDAKEKIDKIVSDLQELKNQI